MVETDIQMTRDGEVVIFHDRNLARLCEGNWNAKTSALQKLNYNELPKYRSDQIVLHFGEAKRRVLGVDPKKDDLRIPKFEELLQMLNERDKKHVWLHVELKVPSMPIVAKTKELLAKYNMENRVIWGCVNEEWNTVLYNANAKLPRNCSKTSVYLIFLGYFFGFIPFLRIKEDSFEIPFYNTNFDQHKKIFEDSWVTRIELFLLRVFWILAKPLLWHLERRGIPCFVFPVNNKVDYLRARGKGVTAVYTDYNNEIL